MSTAHQSEVKKGERFQFGKNWQRFLSVLDNDRIDLAVQSLKKLLNSDRLDGKTFLDIGSGSGLFSLAARKLGANVRSFDYDPHSVACTREMRRRYFSNDENWIVEQGSILDRDYIASLGSFDIVYSWGVLHHTGAMWPAIENAMSLSKIGGQLYIAIYNDLGVVTDRWHQTKRTYNHLPALLRLPFAVGVLTRHEFRSVVGFARQRRFKSYIESWTRYAQTSTRGMSRWHDWIDWIGGYPYERATIETIVDFIGKDGFALERLESRAAGTGCNEFVFKRQAGPGVFINNRLPKSNVLLRQHGIRLVGPFRHTQGGHVATLPAVIIDRPPDTLVLFRDGKLVGAASPGDERGTVLCAPPDWTEARLQSTRFEVVAGNVRRLDQPIRSYSGHMYGVMLPDLQQMADDKTPERDGSPVFLFEDKEQLKSPHSIHDDIVRHGRGRFSHWGQELVFASSDNSDPRSNGRTYELVIAGS